MKRFYRAHERAILGTAGVVLFLILWEGFERGWWAALLQPLLGPQAARFQLKPIFISSPTRIARVAQVLRPVQVSAAGLLAFGMIWFFLRLRS